LYNDRGIVFDGTFESLSRANRVTVYRAKIELEGLNSVMLLEL
jgi:hypothetical protein